MGLSLSSDLIADVMRNTDPPRLRAATERLTALSGSDETLQGFTNLLGQLEAGGGLDGEISIPRTASIASTLPQPLGPSDSAYVDFERMVLRNLLESLLPGAESGAFGAGPSAGVWRTIAADQLAGLYAQAGGIGIAKTLASEGGGPLSTGESQWPYFSTGEIRAFEG